MRRRSAISSFSEELKRPRNNPRLVGLCELILSGGQQVSDRWDHMPSAGLSAERKVIRIKRDPDLLHM